MLEERTRQCRPFRRIGTGPHFVQEHQGFLVGVLRDLLPIQEMRRKGREILGDRLFVPDVGEKRLEYRERSALVDRGDHSTLGQSRNEPDRLQENTLATRVRSGDDQNVFSGIERKVERDDVLVRRREQNRVASPNDDQALDPLGELGTRRTPTGSGPGAGVERIEFYKGFAVVRQHTVVRSQRAGDVREDPVDLPRFLALTGPQIVVERDREGGLDEERGPGVGFIVDTGTTKVGARELHDAIDVAYAGSTNTTNGITISTSENSGTSQDPFADITDVVVGGIPGGLTLMGVGN